jgi:hypothetical protein
MTAENRVRDAVLASASENSVLLVRLASTSEAPSTFQAHLAHVTHLRDTLTQQNTELETLKQSIYAQSKTHQKFRDSIARRFLYRATGMLKKFDVKAMGAEREYFTALGAQSRATDRQAQLEREYKEAITAQIPLEAAAEEHDEVHAKIDALYESLFAGPTPGFTNEDLQENLLYATRGNNENTKERIVAARRGIKLLNQAQTSLGRAQRHIETARFQVEDSILFYDDAYQSLRIANEKIGNTLLAIHRVEELICPLPTRQALIFLLDIAKKSLGSSSYSRENIKLIVTSAQEKLSEADPKLGELSDAIKKRERDALLDIRGTARRFEDTRQGLQQIRQGIFEQVAGFGEAAPAYNECCDRAVSYCSVPGEGDVPQYEPEHEPEPEPEPELEHAHVHEPEPEREPEPEPEPEPEHAHVHVHAPKI